MANSDTQTLAMGLRVTDTLGMVLIHTSTTTPISNMVAEDVYQMLKKSSSSTLRQPLKTPQTIETIEHNLREIDDMTMNKIMNIWYEILFKRNRVIHSTTTTERQMI